MRRSLVRCESEVQATWSWITTALREALGTPPLSLSSSNHPSPLSSPPPPSSHRPCHPLGRGGEEEEDLLSLQQDLGFLPSAAHSSAHASLLRRCAAASALPEGKRLHAHLIASGSEHDRFRSNLIVRMYGSCGLLSVARALFDRIPEPNVFSYTIMIAAYAQNGQLREARLLFDAMPEPSIVTWNSMIGAYAQYGHPISALELAHQMFSNAQIKPSRVTFIGVLSACSLLDDLTQGKFVHILIVENGFHSDIMLNTSLIQMYGACGCISNARRVFDSLPQRDVVAWNAIIKAYAHIGNCKDALKLYKQMDFDGTKPCCITFISILNACAGSGDLPEGKSAHATLISFGFGPTNVILGTALIDMYGKCSSLGDARAMFNSMPWRNTVSWNAMIAAYAHAALNGKEGVSLKHAKRLFDQMPDRNAASWNTMIAMYSQNRLDKEALEMFSQMRMEGTEPNVITFISVLDACVSLAALKRGKVVHSCVLSTEYDTDVIVGNAVLNMYGKCGNVEDARRVFDLMPLRDGVSWNAMIVVYAQNGHMESALRLFRQMTREGMKPNKITFIGVLSACNHAGMWDEGWHYFLSMVRNHNITPTTEHYGCMIDLLGRAGLLDRAKDLLYTMPLTPHVIPYMNLLGACRIQGNRKRGM